LPAEVLIDVLHQVLGGGENYVSLIPEPYTYIPGTQPSVKLFDGSMTSEFLEMFGRPPRDTGYDSERGVSSSKNQRLWTLNSSRVQALIQRSGRLRSLLRSAKVNKLEAVKSLYLHFLSRYPTMAELETMGLYAKGAGGKGRRNKRGASAAPVDLPWALINTKEFQFNH
jgi:hypothetical protein